MAVGPKQQGPGPFVGFSIGQKVIVYGNETTQGAVLDISSCHKIMWVTPDGKTSRERIVLYACDFIVRGLLAPRSEVRPAP